MNILTSRNAKDARKAQSNTSYNFHFRHGLIPRRLKRILIIFLFFLYCGSKAGAQQTPIHNLVFEGAGIRGLAYSGAIGELETRNILHDVKRVGGTSAGAITALLLSLGYNSDEITSIIHSTPFRKFNDGRFFFLGGINRMQKYYGWYRSEQFDKWISGLIKNKTGDPDISFTEMKAKGYKELYVTGTCLNKQTLVVFSHESYPGMKVKDAVRISMSIPLYFEAVFIDAAGNIVKHPRNKKGLDIMIDGGLAANFPIRIFDSTRFTDTLLPNQFQINPHTLGFRIDRDEQITQDAEGKGLAAMPVDNLKEYFSAFYNIIIENLNRQSLGETDWQRTISISDGTIAPKIRKLSTDEIKLLEDNGSKAT
ncbi:MAG: patatin-like phospholipase family protein, partial [Flavisolibacter sp.]